MGELLMFTFTSFQFLFLFTTSIMRDGGHVQGCQDSAILCTQNFVQNLPSCAEFGVLRRIEKNLPNGTENAKILLIFVNPFTYNG